MLNKSEFFSKILFLAVTHIFYNGFGFCTSKIGFKKFLIKMSTLLKKFKNFPIEYNAKIVELFLITSRFLPKNFFNLFSICRIRIRYKKWLSPPKIWRKLHCNLTWTSMRSRLFSVSSINFFSEISPMTLNFFFTYSDVAYQKLFK